MPIPQTKFREIVFQLIYSSDFSDALDEDIICFMMEKLTVTKKILKEAIERREQIKGKLEEIDRLIGEASKAYDFQRITRTEKNILRLAIFELQNDEKIPNKVAISEAVRLARKFATPEGSAFVNAILDSLYQKEASHDSCLPE